MICSVRKIWWSTLQEYYTWTLEMSIYNLYKLQVFFSKIFSRKPKNVRSKSKYHYYFIYRLYPMPPFFKQTYWVQFQFLWWRISWYLYFIYKISISPSKSEFNPIFLQLENQAFSTFAFSSKIFKSSWNNGKECSENNKPHSFQDKW